MFVIFSSLV